MHQPGHERVVLAEGVQGGTELWSPRRQDREEGLVLAAVMLDDHAAETLAQGLGVPGGPSGRARKSVPGDDQRLPQPLVRLVELLVHVQRARRLGRHAGERGSD